MFVSGCNGLHLGLIVSVCMCIYSLSPLEQALSVFIIFTFINLVRKVGALVSPTPWKSQDKLQVSVLSFQHVSSRDPVQVVSLGGDSPHPLSISLATALNIYSE